MGYGIYRLFKFPQMDFEMAIWEMTSLLIAPKKVFRSIYYHVSDTSPSALVSWPPVLIVTPETNKKHMAPPRPFLHLPPLLLHAPHRHRMGHRLHLLRCRDRQIDPPLRLRTLPRYIVGCRDPGILSSWKTTGARHCWFAREETSAGAVYQRWGERESGVWILLRCESRHVEKRSNGPEELMCLLAISRLQYERSSPFGCSST